MSPGAISISPSNTSRTDPRYEVGRSIHQGRHPQYQGLESCLAAPSAGEAKKSEPIPASKKNLRAYREGSLDALIQRLVDCKSPHEPLAAQLRESDFESLLYYLNARYRLKLGS